MATAQIERKNFFIKMNFEVDAMMRPFSCLLDTRPPYNVNISMLVYTLNK